MDSQERQAIRLRAKEAVKQSASLESSRAGISYSYLYGALTAIIEVRDIEYCRIFVEAMEKEITAHIARQKVFS